jgi:hypothetical protein
LGVTSLAPGIFETVTVVNRRLFGRYPSWTWSNTSVVVPEDESFGVIDLAIGCSTSFTAFKDVGGESESVFALFEDEFGVSFNGGSAGWCLWLEFLHGFYVVMS